MPQLGELRTYISAFAILPIMVMLVNEVVLTTFLTYCIFYCIFLNWYLFIFKTYWVYWWFRR